MTLLTPQEVADRLRITRRQVYNLTQQGYLPSVRIGKSTVRIPEDAVEKMMRRAS